MALPLLLVLSGCVQAAPHCAAPSATGIVKALGARAQLRWMLNEVLMRTETAPMIAAKHPVEFSKKLPSALDRAVDKFGPQWEANMIAAYEATLTPAEIKDDCEAINSGNQATVLRNAAKAGERQQAMSTQLLKNAASDSLNQLIQIPDNAH